MDFGSAGLVAGSNAIEESAAAVGRWTSTITPSDPAPQAASDRRSDDRAKTSIYRSALLRGPEIATFCLIRNISSGGLMCDLPAPLATDSPVSIELRSGRAIGARVVWCRDMRVGVEFDQKVDVAALLASLNEETDGWRPRMPRLAARCTATLEIDGESGTVDLIDLSQGGAKVDGVRLTADEVVTLTLPGMEPRRGLVRWGHDGQAGIRFMRAIPFDALARWTVENREAVVAQPSA